MALREPARVFITGRPGVGKSTLFNEIIRYLRESGCRVGGFSAPEVRQGGRRVGFQLVDLMTGEDIVLASVNLRGELRVGRYVVNPDAGRFGGAAIARALSAADVVAIDEIGPMELLFREIRTAVVEALSGGKPLLAVMHVRLKERDPEIYRLISGRGLIVELTEANREFHRRRAGEYAALLERGAGCKV